MAKTITLNFDDKEYVLEFNRETIMALERQGFNINEFRHRFSCEEDYRHYFLP